MKCINLRETFGKKYRVELEPPAKSWNDPWLHRIRCNGSGHIYVHGGEWLGYAGDAHGIGSLRAKAVAKLPGCRVTQDGDDGMNVIFKLSQFKEVARIVRPSKRQPATAGNRLKAFWYRRPE